MPPPSHVVVVVIVGKAQDNVVFHVFKGACGESLVLAFFRRSFIALFMYCSAFLPMVLVVELSE